MRILNRLNWGARNRKETREIIEVLKEFCEPTDKDIVLVKNYLEALRHYLSTHPSVHVPRIGKFAWTSRKYKMPTGEVVPAKVLTFHRCGRFKFK